MISQLLKFEKCVCFQVVVYEVSQKAFGDDDIPVLHVA